MTWSSFRSNSCFNILFFLNNHLLQTFPTATPFFYFSIHILQRTVLKARWWFIKSCQKRGFIKVESISNIMLWSIGFLFPPLLKALWNTVLLRKQCIIPPSPLKFMALALCCITLCSTTLCSGIHGNQYSQEKIHLETENQNIVQNILFFLY